MCDFWINELKQLSHYAYRFLAVSNQSLYYSITVDDYNLSFGFVDIGA